MKFAESLLGIPEEGDDVELGYGGWLSHMAMRAREMLFTRRRRQRPVVYGGREFSTPQLLGDAVLPPDPGIYVIQVRHWWTGLTPIHVGASPNLHEELMVEGHEGFVHWLTHRGAKRGLWVSFHLDHELDHGGRDREGARIYRHYFPKRTHSFEEHLTTHRFHRPSAHRGHHGHGERSQDHTR